MVDLDLWGVPPSTPEPPALSAGEMAALIACALDAGEVRCRTEIDPDRPTRVYLYARRSMYRIDVSPIALAPRSWEDER